MRLPLFGVIAIMPVLILGACSLETGLLPPGGDAATDSGADTRVPNGDDTGVRRDSAEPADADPAVDTGTLMDTSTPLDASPPPDTSVPVDTGPVGPPPGTDLWTRNGPDYDSRDFGQSSNIHFEGDEIHVPDRCRAREMVTIADAASMGWRDYSVAVTRLRFDDGSCGGDSTFTIVARTQDRRATCANQAGYGCSVDLDRDRIYAGRRDGSCGWVDGERAQAEVGSVNTGTQYDLTLSVSGNTVTCSFVNGSSTHSVTYEDTDATYSTGGVAFIFEETDARFGDPSVTAL